MQVQILFDAPCKTLSRAFGHTARTVPWIAAALALNGCRTVGPVVDHQPGPAPPYRDLVNRYNQNLAQTDRLWSRAVVELQWRDDQGKHHEQGDGNLILVLPHRAAISIGKLGNTFMWAGCDDKRYWLFDLRQTHELFTGLHDHTPPFSQHKLPLVLGPHELPALLGLAPIPQTTTRQPPPVTWQDGAWVVEPPGSSKQLWIDPATGRAVRIDLLDTTGQARVTCRLSQWEPVTIQGMPPGAFPWVATRLEISLVDQEGTMTLFLSDLSDGRDGNRIKDKAFDLAHLTKVFKPTKVVDLDRPSIQ